MSDLTFFWKNAALHDATLLLSSDRSLLEQSRIALQDTLDSTEPTSKKRKTGPAAKTPRPKRGKRSPSSQEPGPLSATASAADSCVLTIPVHRIVLSSESAYFRTAIFTLIGDNPAHNVQPAARSFHPIIAVHEDDVEAAQGVLQFLYTKTLDSVSKTAPQLMRLLLVSGIGCLGIW